MSTLERLRRLFRYDDWANRECLKSLEAAGTPPGRSVGILAHIAGAERLWHGRMTGAGRSVVWPELTLEECRRALEELSRLWGELLGAMTEEGLARTVSYVNSKGEPWTSSAEDILTHVVLHSSYHRGQIAADLRASGHAPAYTDYIHAARQGLLDIEGDESR